MTIDEFNLENPIKRVIPDQCWCGAENRLADDHICGECVEHCELRAHREGRDSPRDVELRRQLAERATERFHPGAERRSA
jgi:hypothetical protein